MDSGEGRHGRQGRLGSGAERFAAGQGRHELWGATGNGGHQRQGGAAAVEVVLAALVVPRANKEARRADSTTNFDSRRTIMKTVAATLLLGLVSGCVPGPMTLTTLTPRPFRATLSCAAEQMTALGYTVTTTDTAPASVFGVKQTR